MSKLRPSINDSDEDIYSEGEIRDTEQMDLDGNQTPKCPRVVESDDDEHNSVTNVNITSANVDNDNQNGQNMTPSTNEGLIFYNLLIYEYFSYIFIFITCPYKI